MDLKDMLKGKEEPEVKTLEEEVKKEKQDISKVNFMLFLLLFVYGISIAALFVQLTRVTSISKLSYMKLESEVRMLRKEVNMKKMTEVKKIPEATQNPSAK
ncbi:MAG TPA: hypothetical protein ENO30_05510 [Thermodesulfobium narugense]|nr:hypothetical protein [Thermodesulfobium narugense]